MTPREPKPRSTAPRETEERTGTPRDAGGPAVTAGPATAGEPAVVVEEIVKRFGRFVAVDHLSFSVNRGEIFGFLGPNGAGKSTTIRMLCGIITPTEGRGTVAGFDIMTESERIKERIGYMSQKFSLYEDLTVEENIDFYGDIYGVPPDRLAKRKQWILEMAGLAERTKSLTGELSVGWKQRLALGCAMVHEPEILFLDEPTSGVDPISRRSFWEIIHDAAGRGVTVFVTTHVMDEAEHCGRIAMIYRGKMVALGSPSELKERRMRGTLLEVYAEPFMTAIDLLEAEPGRDVAIFGAALHVMTEEEDAVPAVRASLERGGVTVHRIEPIRPSMEDVFVALVEETDRNLAQAGG